MGNGKITVVRPNGDRISVTEEQAAKLASLGYERESAGDRRNIAQEQAEEDHYTGTGQQVLTGVEGFGSGLTLGLSDVLLGDEDSARRAEYNPGIRIGTEIAGAIAPAFLTGGASAPASTAASAGRLASLARSAGTASRVGGNALRFTPAGMVARAGTGAREAIGGIKGAVAQGVIEGAASGAGAELTRTQLSGDPLTVEGVLASAGLGTAFGAGAGVLTHGFERAGARAAVALNKSDEAGAAVGEMVVPAAESAASVVEETTAARTAFRNQVLPDDAFNRFRGSVEDFRKAADSIVSGADQAVADVAAEGAKVSRAADYSPEGRIAQAGDKPRQAFRELEQAGNEIFGTATLSGSLDKSAAKEWSAVKRAYGVAKSAVKAGDMEKAAAAVQEYRSALLRANEKVSSGVLVPEIDLGVAAQHVEASVKAVQETLDVSAVHDVVKRFPKSANEFFSMKPGKAEQLFAGVDRAVTVGGPELQSVRDALTAQVEELVQRAGIKVEGSASDKLRAVYTLNRKVEADLAKQVRAAGRGSTGAAEAGGGKPAGRSAAFLDNVGFGVKRHMFGVAGASVGSAVGGPIGGAVGWAVGASMAGGSAQSLARIARAVAEWGPKVARVVRPIATRAEPLAHSLSGIQESGTRKDLFKARSQELRELGAVGKDRAFALSAQLQEAGHGDFALMLHQKMTSALEHALKAMPRDQGKTPWGLDSLWEPTPSQLEVFSRVKRAVFSPLDSFDALADGDIHPAEVEALAEAWPELYSRWKSEMLERISDPEVSKRFTRQDISDLSIALRMPLSATQRPEWISAQQQMFAERTQMKPNSPAGSGQPSGPASQATAAQLAEQR